jgi:RNA polymerase-binding transcription factor DksA
MHLLPSDLEELERRLRSREQELRAELHELAQRSTDERFTRVASEVPDTEDAALADVVIDVNNAAIQRGAQELKEVDEALARCAAGTYGVCLRCGNPIALERLMAIPTARYDARCQKLQEHEKGIPRTPRL